MLGVPLFDGIQDAKQRLRVIQDGEVLVHCRFYGRLSRSDFSGASIFHRRRQLADFGLQSLLLTAPDQPAALDRSPRDLDTWPGFARYAL